MSAEASRYRPFSISVERSGREVSLVVAGDLDLASAYSLEREVGQQRAAGSTRVLIDLADVDFIDSTGLRVLLALRNDAKRNSRLESRSPAADRRAHLHDHGNRRALRLGGGSLRMVLATRLG